MKVANLNKRRRTKRMPSKQKKFLMKIATWQTRMSMTTQSARRMTPRMRTLCKQRSANAPGITTQKRTKEVREEPFLMVVVLLCLERRGWSPG